MNEESIVEEQMSYIKTMLAAKNINDFWISAKNILDGSASWDIVAHIKEKGAKKFSFKLFGAFANAKNSNSAPQEELQDLTMFGKELKDCVEQNKYQPIAQELLRMTLKNLIDLYEINHVKHLENLNIHDDIIKNLSQEMFAPFTIFSSIVLCEVFNSLETLSAKDEDNFYALTIGLWQDLQDLIFTEEILKTKNPKRKKQIIEFMDKYRSQTLDKYYDLLESEKDLSKLALGMKNLIQKDPYFFDPYQIIIDNLFAKEKYHEADLLLKECYKKAMLKITDFQGRWPKHIEWAILENRHLIRIIDRFAYELWDNGRDAYAIEIYRKLLKSNPNDNIGVRYNILAINMGYAPGEIEDKCPTKDHNPNFVDAIAMDNWFQKNAIDFPEEFQWWFNLHNDS